MWCGLLVLPLAISGALSGWNITYTYGYTSDEGYSQGGISLSTHDLTSAEIYTWCDINYSESCSSPGYIYTIQVPTGLTYLQSCGFFYVNTKGAVSSHFWQVDFEIGGVASDMSTTYLAIKELLDVAINSGFVWYAGSGGLDIFSLMNNYYVLSDCLNSLSSTYKPYAALFVSFYGTAVKNCFSGVEDISDMVIPLGWWFGSRNRIGTIFSNDFLQYFIPWECWYLPSYDTINAYLLSLGLNTDGHDYSSSSTNYEYIYNYYVDGIPDFFLNYCLDYSDFCADVLKDGGYFKLCFSSSSKLEYNPYCYMVSSYTYWGFTSSILGYSLNRYLLLYDIVGGDDKPGSSDSSSEENSSGSSSSSPPTSHSGGYDDGYKDGYDNWNNSSTSNKLLDYLSDLFTNIGLTFYNIFNINFFGLSLSWIVSVFGGVLLLYVVIRIIL